MKKREENLEKARAVVIEQDPSLPVPIMVCVCIACMYVCMYV